MTDLEIIAALTDREVLALTAWGEARGTPRDDDSHSPIEELVAVMCVVRNRLDRPAHWPMAGQRTFKSICLAPHQFSCWNPGADPNHVTVMEQATRIVTGTVADGELLECLFLADGVMSGRLLDRTGTATSYFAPDAMIPRGRVPLAAAGKILTRIGSQLFYTA